MFFDHLFFAAAQAYFTYYIFDFHTSYHNQVFVGVVIIIFYLKQMQSNILS